MGRRARSIIGIGAAAIAVLLAALGILRWSTFHNETFDLAFYGRMAWGFVHGSFWEPIVGAHVFGLHVSPILFPLGALGAITGATVPVLLVAQAIALAATAWPLARMGHRRFGEAGALAGAAAWLLYPNLGHVGSYEFHPGTLAVLPLAWMLEGLDARHQRTFLWGAVGVLLCREDLALVTAVAGVVAWRTAPEMRRTGWRVALASVGYVLLFALVLHPQLGPEHGSMQLHFGKWGDSAAEAAATLLSRPVLVLEHLAAPQRLLYLPKLLLPLALLPLLRPRWLLIAAPVLAMNLLSDWPTTTMLDSHYQTTALPMVVAGAIDGAGRIARELRPRLVAAGLVATVAACHLLVGGTPVAADFSSGDFTWDARSAAAARVVAAVPEEVPVQAPYALLPHLTERVLLGPPPPPDRNYEVVILDAWHRVRYAQQEDLLRTVEEPTVRSWLASDEYGLVRADGPYLMLARGADPRGEPVAPYLVGTADPETGRPIAACLAVLEARFEGDSLILDFVARDACPRDLGLRIGSPGEHRPRRVDLPFDGLLSPEHLRRGDHVRSTHPLSEAERRRILDRGLRLGALRSSGARPEHSDPTAIELPVESS